MKASMRDQIRGSFHEMKGTLKENLGEIRDDAELRAEGKAEKQAGEIQRQIGTAKEAVAR